MLALISPAKKLDFESEITLQDHTQPEFLRQTRDLVKTAKKLSSRDLASMMKLSDSLAELNFKRFKAFKTPFHLGNAKQAVMVFNGDTYMGLEARTLNEGDLTYAQDHLRILSGLYGLLRPLDLIQPYRLEMGSRIVTSKGENLYGFWQDTLAKAANKAAKGHANPTIINLASNEYFKAIQTRVLHSEVITPVFKETKNGETRVLGMFAKRARGSMAKYMIENRIEAPEGLKDFTTNGYQYRKDLSHGNTWVFARPQPAPVGKPGK